jgi:hypothetical protein
MNKAETRAELIDPALKAARWGQIEHSRFAAKSSPPVASSATTKGLSRILCQG